uniref:Uncharacterized protein n=1 Tax=Anguilla anguilla TaxID=7936 RepID=A0A0E9UPZ5_ANGAN
MGFSSPNGCPVVGLCIQPVTVKPGFPVGPRKLISHSHATFQCVKMEPISAMC